MQRLTLAFAVLSIGAFLTLGIGLLGSGRPALSLLPAAVFVVLATAGFAWVRQRRTRWPAYGYGIVQLALGYALFAANGGSVGASLLIVVLVSQCVLILPLPAVVVIVALVPFAHLGMNWRDGLREGVGLAVAVGFAATVTALLMREQEARSELAAAHARLREYAAQAETLAAAQERNRIARDIHDGLGHALTVVQMQLKAARAVLAADAARADSMLDKAQGQAEQALREVRHSVSALRETVTAMPLPDALRELADVAAGVPTMVDVIGAARELPDDVRESLFRAAQEGLTNVRKHAGASRVEVTLDYSGRQAVRLEVRDDGDAQSVGGTGFGLLGISERAASLGGRAAWALVPGQGSTLRVEVPG